MSAAHVVDTKKIFHQLDKPRRFRRSRTKGIKNYFIAEISDIEKMSKTLNKYMAVLEYVDKTCLFCQVHWTLSVLSGSSSYILIARLLLFLVNLLGSQMPSVFYQL